jgi:ribosomal protein S18 acetylase RimI-like enzyme
MSVDLATIVCRPERPEDEPFLREVHAGTRQEELDAWGLPPEMRAAFLDLQFKAQRQGYRSQFPQAEFLIILLANQPVGRIVLNRTPDALSLIDIALLPEHRNHGIGTALIEKLQTELITDQPLRLSMLKGQRAFRLYQRLGFTKTGESALSDHMEYRGEKK